MATVMKNTKSIVKHSVNIPLELGAISLELVADTTSFVARNIREVVPVTKQLGSITGKFVYGMVNADEKDLNKLEKEYDSLTFRGALEKLENRSISGGQGIMALLDDEEDNALTDEQLMKMSRKDIIAHFRK